MNTKKSISNKQLIGRAVLSLILLVLIFNREMTVYLFQAAKGQFKIIIKSEDINDILEDEDYSAEVKSKLVLLQEIRRFAIDSIGLHDSDNYTTFYDQKGENLVWLLKACPPYKLEPHLWSFPIVGEFPYKGFFDRGDALEEEQEFIEKGYDTRIGKVAGWSTLGFLSDPVLSSMLDRDEGNLAELIFHELTHATVFLTDSMQYNENLATFIGEYGAVAFLKSKYGETSDQYSSYVEKEKDNRLFYAHVLDGTKRLDSLYKSFSSGDAQEQKKYKKSELIKSIKLSLDTPNMSFPERYVFFLSEDFKPNNAYFIGYRIYRNDLSEFKSEFDRAGEGNLRTYVEYLKQKHDLDD